MQRAGPRVADCTCAVVRTRNSMPLGAAGLRLVGGREDRMVLLSRGRRRGQPERAAGTVWRPRGVRFHASRAKLCGGKTAALQAAILIA